jgi:heme oxygenase
MKSSLQQTHDRVENLPFSKKLFAGEITRNQTIAYLVNHWFIFQIIEKNMFHDLPHTSLYRLDAIEKDLELLGVKIDGSMLLPSAKNYVNYILGSEDYESKWNSHVYLNYMAILFGGKIISGNNPDMKNMLDIDNRLECIAAIRELETDEVQVEAGFEYHGKLLEELDLVV